MMNLQTTDNQLITAILLKIVAISTLAFDTIDHIGNIEDFT
jgi:hypothetical protein